MSTINRVAHGLVAGQRVSFSAVAPLGTGLDTDTVYYVITAGLTANAFQISETAEGTPLTLSANITAASMQVVPETITDLVAPGYTAITDPLDVMAPPDSRSVLHSWPAAPGQPQNFIVAPGFKGFGLAWDATTVNDLQFNEVRYAPDDGSLSGPGTNPWTVIRTKSNAVWITGLTIGQLYWAQVRAVDFTDQVVTSGADPTPVDFLALPDAGYTSLLSATPLAVGVSDVAFNSVITNILTSNQIDAGTIMAGILKLNVSDTTMADGIEIWNAGIRVAKWDETGLYIGSQALGLPPDLSGSNYILLNDAGLTVYLNGVAQSAITASGINASAIQFGLLPGGHNLLLNSSFELADFTAAPNTKLWDLLADWTGTQVSATNATNNAGNVTATALTY